MGKTIIGLVAASLTTISFVPQVIKSIKTKDLSAVSLGMYITFVLGLFLWMIYGILLKDFAIFIANVVSFCLASIVLFLKIKYNKAD